ncbi:TetR/AcrR family transcriptional regulator [Homoserinibacter sp. YIM 151385]|uniref:TetR/AcrR family transcriptional regulator n=1 Tax=Homoserinibacter sp. YIM 151385 TaxID=2985506 RepID=UPI0022F02498|nr:TetR/AcrR family transcriptional regulator [Homoserinibacter sp. YIM 151385]WBU39249.1 helix-turn-helix domain containing protein [Homoserinibacter sp. YIM 151385]
MTEDDPRTPRRYDATARRARGERERERTRARILDAAAGLLVERGYAGTAMSAVAHAAGVSVQTVYLAVGAKPALLRAVAARAVLGGDGGGSVPELDWAARLAAEPDPRAQLRILVAELVALAERAAPLWRVTARAAIEDPELAAEMREHESGRRRDQEALVGMLHGLRVPPERASDIVGGLLSPELWNAFAVERGWSRDEIEELAVDMLSALLLRADAHEREKPR